jgi:hypothetical protein
MSKEQFLLQNKKEGEIYAGLILGKNGAPDHHVFLLAARPERKADWNACMAWAQSVGGDLPTRNEQSLLFANAGEHFERSWYWSNTPYAGNSDYAWVQNFGYGYQDFNRKSYEGLAVAVRRLIIQ